MLQFGRPEPVPELEGPSIASDAGGLFVWSELLTNEDIKKNGAWRNFITALDGFAAREFQTELAPGKIINLGDIALEPGASLRGDVTDPSGKPAARAPVFIYRDDDSSFNNIPYVSVYGVGARRILLLAAREDGTFRYDGVPSGKLRAVASAPDCCYAVSPRIDLIAGARADGIHLILTQLPPEATIEGRVLKPDGAGIYSRVNATMPGGQANVLTDAEGKFRHRLHCPGPVAYQAQDINGEFGFAVAKDVAAGSRNIILQLTDALAMELEIINTAGERVAEGNVQILDVEPVAGYRDTSIRPFDPAGYYKFTLPAAPFRLEVRAPGHAPATAGPFEPRAAPRSERIVLKKLAAIEGRIVSDGKPVPGAYVEFHAGRARGKSNGFQLRSSVENEVRAVTAGAHGRFRMLTNRSYRFAYLRATHPQFRNVPSGAAASPGPAPAEYGPFVYDAEKGIRNIEIELKPGGALEGRVAMPAGRDPIKLKVGASRGDGVPRYATVGESGSYRIDHLIPGEYEVRLLTDALPLDNRVSRFDPEALPETPSVCEVFEGQTTVYNFNYSAGADPSIEGSLGFGSVDVSNAKVVIREADTRIAERREFVTSLDARGRFRVSLRNGGYHEVQIELTMPDGTTFRVRDDADVFPFGETPWAMKLAAGRVEGKLPSGVDPATAKLSYYLKPGNPYVDGAVAVNADGTFTLDPAPAGTLAFWLNPTKTSTEAAVAEGKTARVEIR